MSNPIAPAVTPPSPNEWQNSVQTITGISKARNAQVTVVNHGFTDTDVGLTFVGFTQVKGMIQINGLTALITSIVDANNILVNIDTSSFYTYSSGGQLTTISGHPPITTFSFQVYNTPWQNVAT